MKNESQFIHETAVYRLLQSKGVRVPQFGTIDKNGKDLGFKDGEAVVVKGLADNLWHKSDEGALHFIDYSEAKIDEINQTILNNISGNYEWIETLVCKKTLFKTTKNLPSEAFVSIQREASCGKIINFGIGGIHTEAWAHNLKSGIMMWPVTLMGPEDALAELKEHLIGKIWLGTLRQGEPLTSEKIVLDFLKGLWKVAKVLDEENINLLEMNPIVLDEEGVPMALDGVGVRGDYNVQAVAPTINNQAILNPQKIAIAGVSNKASSFGKKIFDNLVASDIPNENLTVIKPGVEEFDGIKCYSTVESLIENPVDMLVLALPAPITVETLKQLCNQGKGAEVVYLVAGGVGDGADKSGYGKQVKELLKTRREKGEWTPSIIGPNSLGIVLSPIKVSTLFISPDRLKINFNDKGNIGFVSQSGAFFITRFSNDENLPIKYGYCIGNQMDLKVSDFMTVLDTDSDVEVIATYIEGFDDGDAIRYAENAKKLIEKGKQVVLYKGGRSTAGMAAAAGHTGAMAGNYQLQKTIFEKAGIIVTESFEEFACILKWLSAYPKFKVTNKVALISNAGFETVGSADHLGEDKVLGREHMMVPMNNMLTENLNEAIKKSKLEGLVSPNNPFDITPMASDRTYLDATRVFAEGEADVVITCIVPLSEMLAVFDADKVKAIADEYKQIADQTGKSIGIVVDSGKLYDEYKEIFVSAGLPVFSSIEGPFFALKNG